MYMHCDSHMRTFKYDKASTNWVDSVVVKKGAQLRKQKRAEYWPKGTIHRTKPKDPDAEVIYMDQRKRGRGRGADAAAHKDETLGTDEADKDDDADPVNPPHPKCSG